jgi:hypothetical protein
LDRKATYEQISKETAVLLGMELDSGGNAIINSEEEKENM